MARKLTLNISDEAESVIRQLAKTHGNISATEVIRKALSSELFLQNLKQENKILLIQNPDNSIQQVFLK